MNRRTFNLVVCFIGITLLLSVAGIITLGFVEKPVDDVLKQLVVGCLTAIGSMLTRPPQPDEAQAVTVVNPPNDPVPVDASDAGHFESGGGISLVGFLVLVVVLVILF